MTFASLNVPPGAATTLFCVPPTARMHACNTVQALARAHFPQQPYLDLYQALGTWCQALKSSSMFSALLPIC